MIAVRTGSNVFKANLSSFLGYRIPGIQKVDKAHLIPRSYSRAFVSHHRRSNVSSSAKPCHSSPNTPSLAGTNFWTSRHLWYRSCVNTFRCLVGCSSGDFSAMWYLQSAYPDLNMMATMGVSMAAGITTSIILETALLHFGRDFLPWKLAAKTAIGMSMISMLAMEITENAVDYSLTRGTVDLESLYFWMSAGLATVAGFLVPLPYNYYRLRAFNKACH